VSKSHVNSTSSKQKRGQKMGVCELWLVICGKKGKLKDWQLKTIKV
jgi:hypothetical protein